MHTRKQDLDYTEYIEIAPGVYWVGFFDVGQGLRCNPYLIVDGDEAVLIDSGSRDDFSTVMLKIMRTGTRPGQIKRLIYQHADPDLCGSVPHMEAIINSPELEIISHRENNIFIRYYSTKLPMRCIERLGNAFTFASGRRLEFILTPFAHAPGSFVTYDTKTKVLFSSDLFGSYDTDWDLYTRIGQHCRSCTPQGICPHTGQKCQIEGIRTFHQRVMPSKKAMDYAFDRIRELDIALVAPQHGSVLDTKDAWEYVIERLREVEDVGIDDYLRRKTP